MNFDFEKYIVLLERRLSLLRLLAQLYVDCRKDFVSMNIDKMYARIGEQEDLCRQIQALHPAIDSLQQTCAKQLGFEQSQTKAAMKLFDGLYRAFVGCDCSMVEINPLVVTKKGDVLALDAKFNFDDNALYRHPEIAAMRDVAEEDPREVEASKHELNYIGLDGNIACLVNGAGLAMATMDIIKFYGGSPANFLDVGGGATEEQVTEAFKILIADKNVKAILVNIFGGIMKVDVIAQGIINAAKTVKLSVPVVVRLEGTNVEKGKQLLKKSGVELIPADDLADAAQKAVGAANPKSQKPNPKEDPKPK